MNVKLEGKTIKDLNGKDLPDSTIGKVIANQLVQWQGCPDPIKAYELGIKFNKCENVELDTSDKDFVEKCIKESKQLFPLAQAQIFLLLKNAAIEASDEEAKEKAKEK